MKRKLDTILVVLLLGLFGAKPVTEAIRAPRTPDVVTVWYVAAGVVALCGLAILALAVRTKRRTGHYPKELSITPDEQAPPSPLSVPVLAMLTSYGLGVLGRVPALKTPLAFVAPGVLLAAVATFAGYILVYSSNPEFRTWKTVRVQILALMAVSTLAAAFYYSSVSSLISGLPTSADWTGGEPSHARLVLTLVPGLHQAVVWVVAVVEACLLAPLLTSLCNWVSASGSQAKGS